jgi:hypothetical protein
MTRRTLTPHAGYVLMAPSGHFLALTKRINNAARFPNLHDAHAVARALTGPGHNGRWEVFESPDYVGDPTERDEKLKQGTGSY